MQHTSDPSTATPANAASTLNPVITLDAADIRAGLYCPNPKSGMPAWSAHPKVFLNLDSKGHAVCPYCGTHYALAEGEALPGGH